MRDWNPDKSKQQEQGQEFAAYLWGIETHPICCRWQPCKQVFSIPMRDWNVNTDATYGVSGVKFSAYLWGIETNNSSIQQWKYEPSFQHTYEGLKPNYRRIVATQIPKVFSIPMRDWNDIPYDEVRVLCKVFSIPMRDWNIFPKSCPALKKSVFSIPMRDWNLFPPTQVKQLLSRFQHTYEGLKRRHIDGDEIRCNPFSAYLWGIETYFGHFKRYYFETSFQHTYEGLKRSHIRANWGSYHSFQHTYEGLKQRTRFKKSSEYSGFQHTYEGLKHDFSFHINVLQSTFSAYLWGIETMLHGESIFIVFTFSAYLWGIETASKRIANSYSSPVFSIPMRDWNTTVLEMIASPGAVFSIPMRDWNFQYVNGIGNAGFVFSIPMRDWNWISGHR